MSASRNDFCSHKQGLVMTPQELVRKLSFTKQSLLGVSSFSIIEASDAKALIMVSFNSITTAQIFLVNITQQFPELVAVLGNSDLRLGNLMISSVSSAPGRCHFSVTPVIQ